MQNNRGDYVEPLLSFISRKYAEPMLASFPLLAALTVDAVLLTSRTLVPTLAWIYVNIGGFSLTAVAEYVFRDRLRRQRCRLTDRELVLPSLVSVGESEISKVSISEIASLETRRTRKKAYGREIAPLTEVELVVETNEASVALIWSAIGFGSENLKALKERLATLAEETRIGGGAS